MARQQKNILFAIAKNRQSYGENAKAEIQVRPKPPGGDKPVEGSIGGSHDSNVDILLHAGTDATKSLVLKHAKQVNLRLRMEGIHFVEKQRASLGLSNEAVPSNLGISEGTPLVSEELILQEGIW